MIFGKPFIAPLIVARYPRHQLLLFGKGQRVHFFNESGGFGATQCRRQLAIVMDEHMLAFGNFVHKTQIVLLFNTQNSASLHSKFSFLNFPGNFQMN